MVILCFLIDFSNGQSSTDAKAKDPYPARGVVPANCMYCKKKDTESGFMYNYNFCDYNSTCFDETWNLQNEWCRSGWKQGFAQRLKEDCQAKEVPCPTFTSSDMFAAKNLT